MPRNRLLLPKLFLVLPVLWLFVVFYVATVIQFNNIGTYKAESSKENTQAPTAKSVQPQMPTFFVNTSDPIYKSGDPNQAGERGAAVIVKEDSLSPEDKLKYKQGYKNNAFNEFASDMISIHRSLPEVPDEECRSEKYSDDLPNTSVIVCFHNEAWSVLLRTVHSILERTPENLLKEIVLVDDFSELKHLKEPLARYMSQFPKVKIVRLEKREGLIRARLRGAAVADGQVLTYLDAHCECTEGWLEPLLDRIKRDPTTVVVPVIDTIDDDTFKYTMVKAQHINVGGFDWSLQFSWHGIPERDRSLRARNIDPVRYGCVEGRWKSYRAPMSVMFSESDLRTSGEKASTS